MAMKDISDTQVCIAYQKKDDPLEQWPYQILMRMTNQPEKVCYKACERACNRGFIEYGVSLRSGWLTEKGQELIKIAAQKSVEGDLQQHTTGPARH